jgi:hypothetical protein
MTGAAEEGGVASSAHTVCSGKKKIENQERVKRMRISLAI